MPSYSALTSAAMLPLVGTAFETAVLDFKRSQDPTRRFEPAKDVAGFANHLGGTLVIGGEHAGGILQRYKTMNAQIAERIETCFSEAVQQRCRPEPVFHADRIPYETGFLVAVNVEPSIPLVGVLAKEGDDGFAGPDNSGHDAWLFPIRVGTGTGFITAERLPMYMLPEIRRKVLILRAMPRGTIVRITELTGRDNYDQLNGNYIVAAVEETTNSVILALGDTEMRRPLDLLECVYKAHDGWRMRFGRSF